MIPGLDTTQRLTKNLIVDESIRELEQQHNRYTAAIQNIQNLMADNERLSMEIATLRSQTENACACLGNACICADMRPQPMGFHAGIESNWLRETGSMYGSRQSVDSGIVRASVQSNHCLNMAEQPLQSFVQTHSARAWSDVQDYQESSIDLSACGLYPEAYVSDSWLSEDCSFRSS